MSAVVIRNALPGDLEDCCRVEAAGFPPEEGAGRETIGRRLAIYPQGFFVAVRGGRVVGMLNCAATHKTDISDEALKQLIGHDPEGRNLVVFSLVVLPEFRRLGIGRRLMLRFIEAARERDKAAILLLCKSPLIAFYERMGFAHRGVSNSTHGGARWHTMDLALRPQAPAGAGRMQAERFDDGSGHPHPQGRAGR